MIRKFAYNKIFRTTGMLLLLLLLLLFPASKKYSLKDDAFVVSVNKALKKNIVYLIDKNNYISRCKVNLYDSDKKIYIEKLLELLILDGKYESLIPNGFKAFLPSDLNINSIEISNNELIIDFSSEFNELNDEDMKKAIELLTYNLTEIENIDYLYIKVNNELLNFYPKSKEKINQPFMRKDGINKIFDINDYKDTQSVIIYFLSKKNEDLYYVPITKLTNSKKEKIEIIIDELTSSHIYETNLMSFLNYNTKLLNYDIKDQNIILNFNKFLFDDIEKEDILEEVIYSICLSIKENYDVKQVIFNVNGKEIKKSVLKDIE